MPTPQSDSSSTTFADYGLLFRRQAWVVVGVTAVFVALAVGYLSVAKKTYTSTESVLVNPISVDGNVTSKNLPNVDIEAQLVKSQPVAQLAANTIAGKIPGWAAPPLTEFLARVSISAPANTYVLEISYAAPTKNEAVVGATAFAGAYLKNRADSANKKISDQVTLLQTQAAALSKQLRDATAQVAALKPNSPESVLAQANKDVISKNLVDVQGQIITLSTTDAFPGSVLTPADTPQRPSSPVRAVILASALALGLMLGLLIAVFRERGDNRVHDARTLQNDLGVPVLVTLPKPPRGQPADVLVPQKGRLGQAYVQLRNALTPLLRAERPTKASALQVTAASEATASVVAANLAAAIARSGTDVVLVCADLEHSAVPQILGVPHTPGLAEVLESGEPVLGALRSVDGQRRLSVLPPGTPLETSSDRLEGEQMTDLVSTLRSSVGVVVLEAPSTQVSADAQSLAMQVDGVVLVVEAQRTTREEVIDAVAQYERAGSVVVGAVLVPRHGRRARRRTVADPGTATDRPHRVGRRSAVPSEAQGAR